MNFIQTTKRLSRYSHWILPSFLMIVAALPIEAAPKTQYLLLDNENMLIGAVEQIPGGYRIHQAVGGSLELPTKKVLGVVDSPAEALAIVRKRANLDDADERLRVARWCFQHELLPEAIVEARQAVSMRASFVLAERYLAYLQKLAEYQASAAKNTHPAPLTPDLDTVVELKPLPYNPETFAYFSRYIQGILNNSCATCHTKEKQSSFVLSRRNGPDGLNQNIQEVMKIVDYRQPAKSKILKMALLPHGGAAKPAFQNNTHPAYQRLQLWVEAAVEGVAPPKEAVPDKTVPATTDVFAGQGTATLKTGFGAERSNEKLTPKVDPFDPNEFNKLLEPKK
ncbi:MAG: hypothetical protein R3B84_11325 [Zavarzinella sp.]